MPYSIQALVEGSERPVCVRQNDPIRTALSLMIEHDFGQLPVVDESERPLGMVTHESILRATDHLGVGVDALLVEHAMVRAHTFDRDEDLFDVLNRLEEANAVLIVDGTGRLTGIVTTYDSTEYFRRRAEDVMLIEDIKTMMKDLIQTTFRDEKAQVDRKKVREVIDKVTRSEQPRMQQYKEAIRHYLELSGQAGAQPNEEWVQASYIRLAPKERTRELDDPSVLTCVRQLRQGI